MFLKLSRDGDQLEPEVLRHGKEKYGCFGYIWNAYNWHIVIRRAALGRAAQFMGAAIILINKSRIMCWDPLGQDPG